MEMENRSNTDVKRVTQKNVSVRAAKRRHRRNKAKNRLYSVLVAAALVLILGYVAFDKCFVIKSFAVKCDGEADYTPEQAETMAKELGIEKGMHLFGFNRAEAEKTARFKLSEFDAVRVRYALPDGIVLEVKPSEPVMYISVGGSSYVLSEGLRVLSVSADASAGQAVPEADGEEARPGDIELHGVSFRYGGAEADTLRGIDLKIKEGERIAVVGYNGAGKTTLVKLLMRLYDPSSGVITLGGRDIREYELKSYRRLFGVVFQDYKQFALSVAENVLGRPMRDGDEAIVEDALRRAGIWDKISELPDGMYTQMTREFSEDGLVLSGGQSQMLAIASVYAHGSPIVILDEPSSALDPLAERELYRQMYSACEGKTMIFISHRLSSAVSADKVVLIEDGVVGEYGSHEELMRRGGRYAEMFRAQAESYTGAQSTEE